MTSDQTSPSSPALDQDSSPQIRRRFWQRRIVVVVVGLVAGVVLAEVAYRVKLAVDVGGMPLGVQTTFRAWNEATIRDDPVAGFRHAPDRQVVGVRVVNGRAVLPLERTSNEAGAIGPPESGVEDAATRILVVGDSFSEIQRGGTTWPALLQSELVDRLGGTVAVINRARSGHGLLQMMDVAADVSQTGSFDVVIIAFIGDDLNRSRFWQETRKLDGEFRLVTRLVRNGPGRPAVGEIHDERIDAAWCRRVVETGGADDPVIADLVAHFEARKRDNPNRIDYASLNSSFLYNRLVFGDPFFGIEGVAATPRFGWWDFRRDSKLVRSVERLRSLGANIVLVHLPQHAEMAAGAYRMSRQQLSLLKSLEQLAGVPALDLIERGNVPARPKPLFLLPYDHHPSRAGLEWYADAVAGVLEQFATAARPGVGQRNTRKRDEDDERSRTVEETGGGRDD